MTLKSFLPKQQKIERAYFLRKIMIILEILDLLEGILLIFEKCRIWKTFYFILVIY